MASQIEIANLALSYLGSEHAYTLDPPKTPNERLMAVLVPKWIDSELRRNNWHFARELRVLPLLAAGTLSDDQPFAYQLPSDCLRVLRQQGETWTVMQRQLWSENADGLTVLCLCRPADPSVYDTLFVDVVAARLAYQACEQITQSNQKKKDMKDAYDEAIDEAKKANAYERFPDDIEADDGSFSWLSCRDNGQSGWI